MIEILSRGVHENVGERGEERELERCKIERLLPGLAPLCLDMQDISMKG
jgi:hypothetical protein